MKKEQYIKHLTTNINDNINTYFSYIDNNVFHTFCSLKRLINENINCLLLNNHIASICVTNHILERFIKLSLIEHGTSGIDYSNDELYNTKLLESFSYDHKVLGVTLQELRNVNLITDQELQNLQSFKDAYRNPYSHADTKRINKDVPNTFKGRMYSLDYLPNILTQNFKNLSYEEKNISTLSPPIAQEYIHEHAINNAFNYFKAVFDIMIIVDKRLQALNSSK